MILGSTVSELVGRVEKLTGVLGLLRDDVFDFSSVVRDESNRLDEIGCPSASEGFGRRADSVVVAALALAEASEALGRAVKALSEV